MIITILKIRLIQLFRLLKEIGFLRIIVLLVLIAFFSLMVQQAIKDAGGSYLVSIMAGVILLAIHASRKDKRFAKISFTRVYFIFLMEYLILSLPVIIICSIYGEWKNALLLVLVCFLIPRIYLNLGLNNVSSVFRILLNPFRSNLNFRLNIRIPVKNPKSFEWISGFRRYFIIIIPVYLVFLAFSFKANVALVGIVVMSIITSGFYYYGEPREFVELFSGNYRTFVFQKIGLSVKYLFIMLLPMVVIAFIFQINTWYYTIGALLLAGLIQTITIIFKYALFSQNTDLGRNGMIVFFNVLCLLLPFFWPLPVIMGIRYYFKAQNKLKEYIDDINH
jgi:hypothetical protein